MFTVTEAFVEGKHADPDRCEDVILDGPDWIALCDGVTDKSGLRFDGRCGGLVVAELEDIVQRSRGRRLEAQRNAVRIEHDGPGAGGSLVDDEYFHGLARFKFRLRPGRWHRTMAAKP